MKMCDTKTIVVVGIADLKVITAPDLIRTSGLGSCVGAVLYDEMKQVAGLAHVLLPESSLAKKTNINKYKYADTAIPILINKLVEEGARRSMLKAKLAGGAQMFQFASNSDVMRIGPRNAEAIQQELQACQIPIISSDLGGNAGRTIEFDPVTAKLKIRKINREVNYI